jgi:DNA-binding beta-propeller fold protein YncE
MIYAVEQGRNCDVRKIDAQGNVTTLAGRAPGAAPPVCGTEMDGIGAAAQFVSPSGVAFDATGAYLYVTQRNGHLRKVAVADGSTTTVDKSCTGTALFGVARAGGQLFITGGKAPIQQNPSYLFTIAAP